ncbi:MAG: hypothetical protein SP1CHLAM54_16370 [Chlamydiia bacterium]|nr:hypothetical protein [Chlamydiia bacterium]MCH9616526.1 hypothetical protein [Chlamydiia bacterium]
MSGVSGPSQGNYSSEANFRGGVRVFKESLDGYKTSTFKQQKDQYVKAMSEAHEVILESAQRLGKSHIQKFKEDYAHFQESKSPRDIANLEEDISTLQGEETA